MTEIKTTTQAIERAIRILTEESYAKSADNVIDVDLYGYRDVDTLLQQLGIKTYNPRGEWHKRYGYEKIRKHAKITNFKILIEAIEELSKNQKIKKAPKILSEEEVKKKWAARLDKLTNCGLISAIKIAKAKIDYKNDRLYEINHRNNLNPSRQRDKLILKMERENPLRRITDKEHAEAILIAHHRHTNTNYEELLEEKREEAKWGLIDRNEVRDLARLEATIINN